MLRVFFSHHKAASSWVKRILFEAGTALRLDVRHIDVPASYAPHKTIGMMVHSERPDIIILNDQIPGVVDSLPRFLGFRVIRDPRDIIVSAYYSHRNSHPIKFSGFEWLDLAAHRELLQKLDEDEGLLEEIYFSGSRLIHPISCWNHDSRGVLEVKMEDLVTDPLTWWAHIFAQRFAHA